jgi:methionyl-tRNA formyltransferase
VRLAFLGTPEPAAVALRALVDGGHDVAIVITRVDKRRGRNEAPRPTPVKAAAMEMGLPVSERVEDVLKVGAELGVVVAFGRIIKADVLDALQLVNVHFSLLSRWRGAAPVERAILAGDTVTGVCLMAIDEGLDTGPVYSCRQVDIGTEETASELRARLANLGAVMLLESLRDGLGTPRPQEGEATYAAKVELAELRLDWSRPALDLHRVVRIGRAWTTWHGRRLLILTAHVAPAATGRAPGSLDGDLVATGDGRLQLVTVQPEGRAPMAASDWLHGARPRPGELLGV